MPTLAAYHVLRDSAFPLPNQVDTDRSFDFDPPGDIRLDVALNAPVLSFRVHPRNANNLGLTVSIVNETAGATRRV